MGEIKRVLFNKKYIALLLTIFIANIAVFQYFQVEALGRMNSEEELEIFIYELEQKQQEEHDKFYRKIKEVPRQKANMLEMSIFAEEDSFAYKNIMKTAGDYERISEVELSEINDYAVDAFLEYDVMYIFGFVLMLFTVTAFLDERKKGLWQIVYTCRGGRLRLLLKRVAILLGVALVTETVLVVSTLSVSFMNYGGIGILFDSVQSVGKLQGFMMPVSTLSFLVYYILFLAASHAVSGLFIWFVLSLIHNGNLGMIGCAASFAAVMFFVRFYEVRTKYNLKGLAAPVQNIRIYENVSLNVSIGEYMALWYGARAMLFVMATCIVMMISACVKKQNKVYLLSMLLVPIGLLNGIVEYPIIISIVVSVAISVMCCIRTYNEWTNTGRKIA